MSESNGYLQAKLEICVFCRSWQTALTQPSQSPSHSAATRHVARLRRLGGATKNFRGNSYWSPYSTNHRNHWQRHYYENGGIKQCCERSNQNFFLVNCTPIVTFWLYISRKWSQKFFKWICLGARRQFGGGITPVPLPGYVTGSHTIAQFDVSEPNYVMNGK